MQLKINLSKWTFKKCYINVNFELYTKEMNWHTIAFKETLYMLNLPMDNELTELRK